MIKKGSETPTPIKAKQNQALDKIRPELNLEKWSIWKPSKSKNRPEVRVIEREITLADGSKVKAKVHVDFTSRGELTTEDQKTYYALIKYWEEHGRSEQQTLLSLNQLAKYLKKRGWGTNVIESITESLMRLRGTLITWENSYYDGSTKDTIELLDTFNILSELRIAKRKTDGIVNKAVGYFKFNDFILKNLQANHTKPLLLDTVLSFNSELAQLLYVYLDLRIADKTHYERRSKELFDDLGIKGKAYNKPSDRKRQIEKALKELQGKPLSTGVLTIAALEETVDGKDYKVVFHKGSYAALTKQVQDEPIPEEEAPQIEREETAPSESTASATTEPEKNFINEQSLELVKYFHKIFFNVDKSYPGSKEVAQAITVIANHGVEQSKYIIDFAHKEAPATNFQIKTFGGILQYTSAALAEYETKKHQQEQQAQTALCPLCKGRGYIGIQHPGHDRETATRCPHKQELLDALLSKHNAKRAW